MPQTTATAKPKYDKNLETMPSPPADRRGLVGRIAHTKSNIEGTTANANTICAKFGECECTRRSRIGALKERQTRAEVTRECTIDIWRSDLPLETDCNKQFKVSCKISDINHRRREVRKNVLWSSLAMT